VPGISIPTLLQSIAPLLLPNGTPQTGNNTSLGNIGPGGVVQTPPNNWNATPPSEISSFTTLEEFIDDQEVNNSRNIAEAQELGFTSQVNLANDVDSIIERNRSALGLTGGANGFYEIDLVSPASGGAFNKEIAGPVDPSNPQFLGQEPDGFRMYLICPPRPAVSVALAAIGGAIDAGGDAIKTGTDAVGGSLREGIGQTGAEAIGLGEQAAQAGASIEDAGAKVKEVTAAIKKYMEESGQEFNDKFDQYIKNAYDGPEGNSFYSIILPMPKELTDAHSHNTDNLMLGVLPRAAAAMGIGLNNFSNSISKRYKDAHAKRITGENNRLTEFLGAAGEFVGAVGAEAGAYAFDTARARLGIGLNPNVETIYATPNQRQFQFTFELYVKSREEAVLVKDFIQKVKEHSYPLSVLGIGGQSQLYLYPGEVYFEFSGRYKNNLFRSLKPCLITNVQVQYGNQDQYQHFEDGSSIVYVVSITLLENRLLDRNILVDDREQYQNDNFANQAFRNNIRFGETFLGEQATNLLTEADGSWNFLNPNSPNNTIPPTPNNP
jgi:hypothetical protein